MSTKNKPYPKFTIGKLFLVVGFQAALVALLETYWRWKAGKWEATSLTVVPVMVWIGAAAAYRWRQIMKEQADGSFSLDLYRADPQAYLFGAKRLRRFVIIIGVVIGIVCIALITTFHLQ
jgi:hypothetical protein